MKDIDFDELDRAVSSLMGSVSNNKPTDTTPATSPVADDASNDSVTVDPQPENTNPEPIEETPVLNLDRPVEAMPSSTPEPQADTDVETFSEAMQLVEEGPAVSPAPAARRGRFMDVVRPAVRETSKSAPSRAVSRQGVSLQPSTTRPEPEEVSTLGATAQQPNDSAMADFATAQEDTFVESTPQNDESVLEPVVSSEPTDLEAPLSSPFLPDAKVEKRPLGRPTTESAPVVDLAAELTANAPESTTATAGIAFEDTASPGRDAQLPEQPLPAELGSELLTIETSMDNLPPEPVQAPQSATAPESNPAQAASLAQAPEPTRVITGASIPQQYKVQPQTPMDEAPAAGTIYDAQPLVHTAEKKSSWIWKLVAIIAIALLGAGGGAAIYYLGLI